MNEIEIIKTTPAEGRGENLTGLFSSFVSYIDRGAKTTRNALNNLKQFAAWLKYAGVLQPIRDDILSYRQWLSAEHEAITLAPETAQGWTYRTDSQGKPVKVTCAAATVKQYLQTVKQFFSWTAASGLYPNIAANVHAPKISDSHKKDSLTAGEVLAIETSIAQRAADKESAAAEAAKDTAGRISRATEQGKRLYAMYLLAVNAGMRTVELSRANVADLQTRNGHSYIMIWGKGRSTADQKKPIAPEVAAAIRDYLAARADRPTGTSPLFVSTGNRSGGKRIAETTISTMLKRAMQAAGFDSPRLTAHSLRHTTGENVLEITGKNIYQTQQYMRHADPKTTEIYLDNETTTQDEGIAQSLYNRYHGRQEEADSRQKVITTLDRLSPEQLESLASIAAAMAI